MHFLALFKFASNGIGIIFKTKRKRKGKHCKSCLQLRTCHRLLAKVVDWTRSLMKAKRNLSRYINYPLLRSAGSIRKTEARYLIVPSLILDGRRKEKMYCALYYFFLNLETRPLRKRYDRFN